MRKQLENKLIMLAPLAGITDVAFRLICEKYGADKTFTEMVSVNALYYKNKKTDDLLYIADAEKNCNIQLFGHDPEIIEKVIKEKINPIEKVKEISFNMGCPVKKITQNGEGSALMANPSLVRDICRSLVKATDKKVNIKFRLGINEDKKNYLQIGKIAQDEGIDYVIMHARYKEQMYSGKASWDEIRILKENLSIPVIANGDIFSVEDFLQVINISKADGVMLARGAMGNPFLFKQIKDYIKYGKYDKISPRQIIDQLIGHYKLAMEFKEEKLVVSQMRKHLSCYIKGLKNSARIREKINTLNNINEVMDVLEEYKSTLEGW